MANNEIPRWAQAALERNERIQSKARSAVALLNLMEERDRLSRLAPDTLGVVDPNYSEEVRYEAPGVIRDPESWLNRGLETLAGNAADVILGRPSENPVVDYGLAPIPGVGAAAILGAGGQPGLVDAVGAGALKNLNKIPKYTLDFVSKHFGEKGLSNLDNALSKFPKAGKPSVRDAIEIMRSGLGGERVGAKVPYSLDVETELAKGLGVPKDVMANNIHDGILQILHEKDDEKFSKAARWLVDTYNRAISNNNLFEAYITGSVLEEVPRFGLRKDKIISMADSFAKITKNSTGKSGNTIGNLYQSLIRQGKPGGFDYDAMRELKEVYESPLQDWEKIAKQQEMKDARDADKRIKKEAWDLAMEMIRADEIKATNLWESIKAEKAAKKKQSMEANLDARAAEKAMAEFKRRQNQFTKKPEKAVSEAKSQGLSLEEWLGKPDDAEYNKQAQKLLEKYSYQPAPKVEPVAPKEEPVVVPEPVATPVETVVEPVVVPEVPKGGPNMWEENGWTSKDVNPALFEKYGRNLNEKSKRDAFVVDSLANHWGNRLMARPGFTSAEILDNLDRANARHTFTNYDDVSRGFYNDVESNLRSGNMPGTAVQLLQRYKNNVRVPGKTAPTMILELEERPRYYDNPRIMPDELEGGVDLYELLFRPMIDRKLNEINPNYWTY